MPLPGDRIITIILGGIELANKVYEFWSLRADNHNPQAAFDLQKKSFSDSD